MSKQVTIRVPGDHVQGKRLTLTHKGQRFKVPVPTALQPGELLTVEIGAHNEHVGQAEQPVVKQAEQPLENMPAKAPAGGSESDDEFIKSILDTHNQFRDTHGVPHLEWDSVGLLLGPSVGRLFLDRLFTDRRFNR